MSETAARTDKRFQRMVLGGIGLAVIVIFGTALAVLETSTIAAAAATLALAMLITIGFLAVEL